MKSYAAVLGLLLLTGCAENVVYPISHGSHAPIDPANKEKKYRFVVWGNHAASANWLSSSIQRKGHTIVERARIQEVLNEQKMRLTSAADHDADILHVGRLVGADRVVFLETSVLPENYSTSYTGAAFGRLDSWSNTGTLYHLSVAVRAVNVETGEVRWQGNAQYPQAVSNPDQGLVNLTSFAVSRALCPIEDGYLWIDQSGCKKPE